MTFKYHPKAKERLASAKILIKLLLGECPGLLPEHQRECIRQIGLYKVTEAEGVHKRRTRFMSVAAIAVAKHQPDPSKNSELQHEHVFKRAELTERLVNSPGLIDSILKDAIGCTVTKDEHDRLSKIKTCDGWKRYREAKIAVENTETGEFVDYGPI
jgi:hypothetical protein